MKNSTVIIIATFAIIIGFAVIAAISSAFVNAPTPTYLDVALERVDRVYEEEFNELADRLKEKPSEGLTSEQVLANTVSIIEGMKQISSDRMAAEAVIRKHLGD